MFRPSVLVMLIAMMSLTGCDAGRLAAEQQSAAAARPSPSPSATTTPAPAAPSATPATTGTPSATDTDGVAAADVVRRYHALIAARRYADAYRLWEPGAAGMDAAAFAVSFGKYESYAAQIGAPGRVDAGAGQRFVEIPVRVAGRLRDGGAFALEGPMTLHRTADIDGATAEQRSWRIRASGLKPRPAGGAVVPPSVTARYRCMDGSRMRADFDNAQGIATIRRAGAAPVVLRQQPAASGIRYAGDGHELTGKGPAATFAAPGRPPIACTAIR